MDVYLLSDNYERIAIIDEFESFIWTERHSGHGDFELVVPAVKKWKNLIRGRYLAHDNTRCLMIIEKVIEREDSDGSKKKVVSGRSLESILMRRTIIPWVGRTQWLYRSTVGNTAYLLLRNMLMSGGSIDEKDIIPDLYVFNGTSDTEEVEVVLEIKSLYDAVKELCDTKNFGFGIDLMPSSPRLRLYIYEGVERPNLIFSSQLDTLTEESRVESDMDYYNIAYVYSNENERRISTGLRSLNPDLSGVDRRVISIYASDLKIDEEITLWSRLDAALIQRGREELAKHPRVKAFDGKLTGLDPYVFKTHYQLGDVVTLMNDDNETEKVRVSEYIWGIDSEGLRHYPTFEVVNP